MPIDPHQACARAEPVAEAPGDREQYIERLRATTVRMLQESGREAGSLLTRVYVTDPREVPADDERMQMARLQRERFAQITEAQQSLRETLRRNEPALSRIDVAQRAIAETLLVRAYNPDVRAQMIEQMAEAQGFTLVRGDHNYRTEEPVELASMRDILDVDRDIRQVVDADHPECLVDGRLGHLARARHFDARRVHAMLGALETPILDFEVGGFRGAVHSIGEIAQSSAPIEVFWGAMQQALESTVANIERERERVQWLPVSDARELLRLSAVRAETLSLHPQYIPIDSILLSEVHRGSVPAWFPGVVVAVVGLAATLVGLPEVAGRRCEGPWGRGAPGRG